jgi:ribosomal subunit interface protein
MQLPPQITFRNMTRSPAIEANVLEHLGKLEKFSDRIMSCSVAIEALHKHHRQGNHYHVRIDLRVPGGELVTSRQADEHHAYTDAYVAIRDAFGSLRRQLEDYSRRKQRQVKTHETPLHGRVVELNPAEDYGRIETQDGRLVYFHRNSVVKASFDDLSVGAEVRFSEELGERGPQASTVHLVGKHHIVG